MNRREYVHGRGERGSTLESLSEFESIVVYGGLIGLVKKVGQWFALETLAPEGLQTAVKIEKFAYYQRQDNGHIRLGV